jgi:quinol monooxygenase YgiN
MHVASVRLQVLTSKQTEALSAIAELMRRIRLWPGCLDCRLFTAAEDTSSLTLVTEWESRQTVDHFLASTDFLILKGMRMLLREEPQTVLDGIVLRSRLH